MTTTPHTEVMGADELRARITAQRRRSAGQVAEIDAAFEGGSLGRGARQLVARMRGALLEEDRTYVALAREVDRRAAGKGSDRAVRKARRAADEIGRRRAALEREMRDLLGGR